jgi:RNA polymerase sigma-70 factor (ECF subfamily)
VTESELQIRLMERADGLHTYVERRIPSRLRRVITPEDVLQEVWIAAFRTVSAFKTDSPDAVDRWLMTIARSKLISAVRHARCLCRDGGREVGPSVPDHSGSYLALFSRLTVAGRTPSSEEAACDAVRAVQIALSAMQPDYQQAITLRHIEGRTHGEVATVMNRTTGAVNSLLHRGMLELRERLGSPGRFFNDADSSAP